MSPAPADEPLHRTNINLFASDVEVMERLYGRGWTEKVRSLVRDHVHLKTKLQPFQEQFDAGDDE